MSISGQIANLIRYNYDLSYKIFTNEITNIFTGEEITLICRKSKNPEILVKFLTGVIKNRQSDCLFIDWVVKLFAFIKNGLLVKCSAKILLPKILSILQKSQKEQKKEEKESDEEDNNS